MADEGEPNKRVLFVLPATNRIKVAGGEEHDLPLSDPENQEFLDMVNAANGAPSNDIVVEDLKSPVRFDLLVKGKHNPHRPLLIEVHRIPLVAELDASTMQSIAPLMEKEPGKAMGISDDVVAMSVLAKMQPEERAKFGIKPFSITVNTCERAKELAREHDEKRAAVAAKVAAAAAAKQ